MKPKNFKKKLTLNKKTIADLSTGQLEGVKGGFIDTSPFTCGTESVCFCRWTDTCETCETCVTCNTCNTCNYTCGGGCSFKYTCAPECTVPVTD